ncbi:DUF4373 domain-containing protein [Lentilactobacillus senioris]|uniref:Lin1244/Lin1753 domain-containing protein n=1 Tax=Lentilactobacillus senioris TaxID=931534 RepID=UPI002282B138|nr:Lin1244/Lin1753 domain-containing protein [Lentilactobacillus senioris]MCY9807068.1 DUF4373 domain-containing protein [Lentilactobacillus senioris]
MNSYFPHDSNARNSMELIKVRAKYKAEGYGVFWMLLERLRDEDNYMSIRDYNAIAFDLRVDASLVKSIVEDFGLFVFTDDGKYFYSEGFNKRMSIKDEKKRRRSEAGKKGATNRWKNEENSNAMAMPSNEDSNAMATPPKNDGKESKVNETKPNNKKNSASDDGTTSFESDFDEIWEEYPNKKGKKAAFNHYRAWRKKSVKHTNEYLFERLRLYKLDLEAKKDWLRPMNGSTWFNGRFDDTYDSEQQEEEQTNKNWFGD